MATARNPASLSAIPDNPNVLKLTVDVTSTPSIDAALKETVTKFGRIDVVVNNAGYTLVGDTEVAGDEESRALFDTNFWGMVDVTKRVIGIMRDQNPRSGAQQGGVVLNVSSMGGFMGFPGSAFYHASKFAMEGWTEAVAKELPVEWNSKSMLYDRSCGFMLMSFSSSMQYRAGRRQDELCNFVSENNRER